MPAAKLHIWTERASDPSYRPQPKLRHVSCKRCPTPGDPLHPSTRVPYLQSINTPGNMLVRSMQISRNIRTSTGRRGGHRVQFGDCSGMSLTRCPRPVNALGGWFGAPGGSRAPPRNSF